MAKAESLGESDEKNNPERQFRIDTYHASQDPHDSPIYLASGENGLLSIGVIHLDDGVVIVHANTIKQSEEKIPDNELTWNAIPYYGDFAEPESYLHMEKMIKSSGVANGLHEVTPLESEPDATLSPEILELIEMEITLAHVLERLSQ